MRVGILVLGTSGLLGSHIYRKLCSEKNDFFIVGKSRKDIDIFQEYKNNNLSQKLKEILWDFTEKYCNVRIVINCIGITNKKPILENELFVVNSYFPVLLDSLCHDWLFKLIHVSTDCVFSGKKGNYTSSENPDPVCNYGLSKYLGDQLKYASIIRASIIGSSDKNEGLVDWVKNYQEPVISGYINHYWNGMTCIEYSKMIREIIQNVIDDKEELWTGIRHYSSLYKGNNKISKYQLIKDIVDLYGLNITVNPVESNFCDRTLLTEFSYVRRTSLENQLAEMVLN